LAVAEKILNAHERLVINDYQEKVLLNLCKEPIEQLWGLKTTVQLPGGTHFQSLIDKRDSQLQEILKAEKSTSHILPTSIN